MASKLKMTRYAAALVAGTALVAPTAVWAADADITDIDATETLQAPIVNGAATFAYGTNVRYQVDVSAATAAEVDEITPYVFLYDNSGNYLGFVAGTADAGGDATIDLTFPLPTQAGGGGYTQFVLAGATTGDPAPGPADDTFSEGADAVGDDIIVFQTEDKAPTDGTIDRTDFDVEVVNVAAGTTDNGYGNNGVTNAEANAIGGDEAVGVAANFISINSSTYSGPVLQSANKDAAGTPSFARLSFNAILADPGNDNGLAGVTFQAGSTDDTGTVVTNTDGTGIAGYGGFSAGDTSIFVDGFGSAVDNVDILTGSDIEDEAGNSAAATTNATITQFADPAYATSGAQTHIVTDLDSDTGGDISAATIDSVFDEDGVVSDTTADDVVVSVRFEEPISATNLDANDFSVNAASDLAVSAVAGGGSDTIAVTLTKQSTTDFAYRFNPSNGTFEFTSDVTGGTVDNGATWTAVSVQAVSEGGDEMQTTIGETLDSNLDAVDAVAGVTPSVTLSTLDDDANGTLDGGQYEFVAPLATPLAGTNGVEVSDDDDSATAAATVSTETGDDSVLKAVSSEAALTGFLESSESAADNLNTGTTGGDLPFTVEISNSEITYDWIYDVSDGELQTIADQAATSPANDGASPVVLSASFLPVEDTDPAAGNLQIVASEAIRVNGAAASPPDEEDWLFGGSPLNLVNLNVGLPADLTGPFPISETNTANDTLTIEGAEISDFVAGTQLTLGSTPEIEDFADNQLATTGVNVGTGATQFAGPTIQSATAFRSSGDVDGNVDRVLVQFDKNMQLDGGSAFEDGQFKLQIAAAGLAGAAAPATVSIPGGNVDTAQIGNGYVILAIPAPGIVGEELNALNELTVEFDQGENVTLQSTDGEAVADDDGLGTPDFNTAEPDASTVVLPDNSNELYTMELTGTLNSGGSAVREGTIVRADLVSSRFTEVSVGTGVINQVPCNDCRAGGFPIGDKDGSALESLIREGLLAGERRVDAFLSVDFDNQGKVTDVDVTEGNPGAFVDDDDAGGGGADDESRSVHRVEIDVRNGRISGDGVRGSIEIEESPASGLVLRDTSYQVTDDQGFFRLSVGQEQQSAGENEWVLVSVRQPQADDFTAITYSSPALARYVPFASNVTASGTIGGKLGTVELDDITTIIGEADDGRIEAGAANWQLIGWRGDVAGNENFRGRDAVDPNRLFIGMDEDTGEPQSAWLAGNAPANFGGVDNDGGNSDETFTLTANEMTGAFQLPTIEKEIDNISSFPAGQAMAFRNDGDDNDTRVFLPLEGSDTPTANFRSGWSLVTFDADQSLTSSWAESNSVGAVIDAGGGDRVKTWFRDADGDVESGNTLESVSAGDRVFIYFRSNTQDFAFGR